MKPAIRLVILVASPLFTMGQALACIIIEPIQDKEKAKATTVFIGEPVKYVSEPANQHGGISKAIISFKVLRTERGEDRRSWDVTIHSNINWSPPGSLARFKECFGSRAEVGIRISDQKSGSALAVQNEACNPPYILPLTPRGMNCIP